MFFTSPSVFGTTLTMKSRRALRGEKNSPTKSYWKDIWDLRKPNSTWRLRGRAKWFAKALDLPSPAVFFMNPDGSRARSNKTLGALKKDWRTHLAKFNR